MTHLVRAKWRGVDREEYEIKKMTQSKHNGDMTSVAQAEAQTGKRKAGQSGQLEPTTALTKTSQTTQYAPDQVGNR